MKKVLAIVIILSLMLSITAFAEETDDIKVVVNGVQLNFDVPPQLINDRTMVPMRAIFETLGAKVEWVDEAQLILATYNTCIMVMQIGKDQFVVTDVVSGEEKVITLDVAPQVINDRTLVPVRAISESMGKTVEWVDETQTVVIY